jgi:hypothetical protein
VTRFVRTMRRTAGVLAGTVLALHAFPVPQPAGADSPVIQTWWTANNLTVDLPLPPDVVAPGAIPPITIPVTDVPDGGSEVAGATARPTGALTLRYEFPEGSTLGELRLDVAPGVPPTPATELIACPLTGDGTFETHPRGGPIAKLPASDCSRSVPGTLDETGATFRFEGIASLAAGDHLSIAILPVAGRAVLERALSESLAVTVPDGGTVGPLAPEPRSGDLGPVTAPTFLGQVRIDAPTAAPAPVVSPAVPAPPIEPIAERLLTVFRGAAGGQGTGSAVAGLVLLALAASSVWRRGRAALHDLPVPT